MEKDPLQFYAPSIVKTLLSVQFAREEKQRIHPCWQKHVDRLLAFRNLSDDWDGQGAVAPSEELVDYTIEYVKSLEKRGWLPPTGIGPGANGTILLDWQLQDLYLEAEVTAPHVIEWMFEMAGHPSIEGDLAEIEAFLIKQTKLAREPVRPSRNHGG